MMLKIMAILLIIMNIILGYQIFISNDGLSDYHLMLEKYNITEVMIKNTTDINKSLSYEIELLKNNPEYIQQAIRKDMKLLRDNEVLYIFD